MSIAAVDVGEGFVAGPDTLKTPESPLHRQLAEAFAAAIDHALGDRVACYRDMNWYPVDGGQPIAPDVMVLSPGTLAPGEKSYRQPPDGTLPDAVVEIPSDSGTFTAFRAKLRRLQRLGTVVYAVSPDPASPSVLRLGPDHVEAQPWSGRPMVELGGRACTVTAGEGPVLSTADGRTCEHLRALIAAERDAAVARVAELERQLHALGIEPA